ncbi:TPA: transporter [Pseudomonas aeruginosa]|nr:transporter [Pseudomonas aeruginosa]
MRRYILERHFTLLVLITLNAPALAVEKFPAFSSGITTGFPVGALPPPGVHVTIDTYMAHASQHVDGQGNKTSIKVENYVIAPYLLWSTDRTLLGARYGAGILQPFALHKLDTSRAGGTSTKTQGMFNTILMPIILSWDLGEGFFTSSGLAVYLPNGHKRYQNDKPTQENYANDYWTFEPNFAISYLKDGWNLTINNVFDFNRTNRSTDYKSGTAYYMDITTAKTIDHWTIGLIGNYSRQIVDDRQYGHAVGDGNRFEHILLGPMIGYDLDGTDLKLRYLHDVRTRNDLAVSMLHISISFKL